VRTRYYPWQMGDGTWGLIDWREMDFCRLPVKDRKATSGVRMEVLRWKSRAAADAFLQRCYMDWARWERGGTERADQVVPRDWRPRPERFSPYANGMPAGLMPDRSLPRIS
jgi:hypothetical protein